MLMIEDVGVVVGSLYKGYNYVSGIGIIYSVECGEEYCDRFKFNFNINKNTVECVLEDDIWEDFVEDIKNYLIENMVTNFLIKS